jgi:hypothetical protein
MVAFQMGIEGLCLGLPDVLQEQLRHDCDKSRMQRCTTVMLLSEKSGLLILMAYILNQEWLVWNPSSEPANCCHTDVA